jgi:hypothetical protein
MQLGFLKWNRTFYFPKQIQFFFVEKRVQIYDQNLLTEVLLVMRFIGNTIIQAP